jgi:hypothetical protein
MDTRSIEARTNTQSGEHRHFQLLYRLLYFSLYRDEQDLSITRDVVHHDHVNIKKRLGLRMGDLVRDTIKFLGPSNET